MSGSWDKTNHCPSIAGLLPMQARMLTISTTKASVNLSAVYSRDEDGKLVKFLWRKVSGPSVGTIMAAESADGQTRVVNLTSAGTYVYELKAVDDRADWSTDQVTITVVNGTCAQYSSCY